MSIRARLLLIVFLSGGVLAIAIGAIAQLVSSSDAAKFEAAQAAAEAVAESLADAWNDRPPGDLSAPSRELGRFVERAAGLSLGAAPRAIAGVCTGGVAVMHLRLRSKKEGAKPAPLVGDARSAVESACAAASTTTITTRAPLRNGDVLVIAVAPAPPGAQAFAAIAVKTSGVPRLFRAEVIALAAGTLLLVIVSIGAIAALRRGVAQVDGSLERLQRDLSAPVETPNAEELARIAAGLQKMARHLADAHARERDLARSLEHEQRLSALGRVAAGVAHEIRNPLAGMKLRLDLMARAPDVTPELRADVRACLEEVDRLDRVVRSLLGVARRPEEPARETFALGPFVDERIALVEHPRAKFVRRGDATVTSDRDALTRVLDNLLRNADEASPEGSEVVIELTAHGERVEVAVIDEGPGIPEARASELFEPFFTTKPEGTGLGLFLSRSLVQALGGTLRYAREDGRTRFTFDVRAARK